MEQQDQVSPALEKFLLLLEERMITGHSYVMNREWAATFGVDEETLRRLEKEICAAWQHNLGPSSRAQLREKYHLVFKRAVEAGQYKSAVLALDGIAKLDGLVSDTTNVNVGVSVGITNASRSKIVQMLDRMRELAGKRNSSIKVLDVPMTNGRNGHCEDGDGDDD